MAGAGACTTAGEYLTVSSQAGGIQLLARLTAKGLDRRIAQEAWQRGLSIQALSDWHIASAAGDGLLMGFANFTQQSEAERAVARLAELFEATN